MKKEPFATSLARADAERAKKALESTRKNRKVTYPKWTATTPYTGGKQRPLLRKWITDHLPTEGVDCYVEPFAGAASILMARPRVEQEVLVERCRNQWALLTTIRDQPERLVERLACYGVEGERDLFEIAKEALREGRYVDELDVARCQLIRNCLSVNAKGTSFRPPVVRDHKRPILSRAVAKAAECSPRLQGVEIINADSVPLLADYDSPTTLFYLDPPYHHSRRVTLDLYDHEMSTEAHERMLRAVLRLEGKVAISGYDNELYKDMLTGRRWRRVEKAYFAIHRPVTEVLWLNY